MNSGKTLTPKIFGLSVLLGVLSPLAVWAEQICQTENIPATAPASRYQVQTNATVIDTQTGLMWRRCIEGTGGSDCFEGEPEPFTWAEVLLYVPKTNTDQGFAGYHDWRVPNIRELISLAELQCARPAINLAVFPNPANAHLWSSSPYDFYPHYSWYVDFGNGAATYDLRTNAKYLRLVRDAH